MIPGIEASDEDFILRAFEQNPEIEKVILFGSRAKGTFKRGSDIDLAISGQDITSDTVYHLHSILEDTSPMPYLFDVVDYNRLESSELKKHIDRVGCIVYEKRI